VREKCQLLLTLQVPEEWGKKAKSSLKSQVNLVPLKHKEVKPIGKAVANTFSLKKSKTIANKIRKMKE
jgi:hypothetical protein